MSPRNWHNSAMKQLIERESNSIRESTVRDLMNRLDMLPSRVPLISLPAEYRQIDRLARRVLVFAALHIGNWARGEQSDDQAIECLLELAQSIPMR
jgi:hypothetical protein